MESKNKKYSQFETRRTFLIKDEIKEEGWNEEWRMLCRMEEGMQDRMENIWN